MEQEETPKWEDAKPILERMLTALSEDNKKLAGSTLGLRSGRDKTITPYRIMISLQDDHNRSYSESHCEDWRITSDERSLLLKYICHSLCTTGECIRLMNEEFGEYVDPEYSNVLDQVNRTRSESGLEPLLI